MNTALTWIIGFVCGVCVGIALGVAFHVELTAVVR